ncbi:MAG TPA: hypothetical protein VFE31_16525, partial [Opitutaceae bacterium]|nr:hypothetical protein [Opitutaceae bacterium]
IAAAAAMLAMLLPWWFRPVDRTQGDWVQDIVSGRDFGGRTIAGAVISHDRSGWHSNRFTLGESFLYVPYQAQGALLEADIFDGAGFRVATVRHAADSGRDVGFWRVDVRGWRGLTALIRATPAGAVNWVSAPILSARSIAALPPRPVPVYLQTNYLYYAGCLLGIAALLFVPGWALGVQRAAYLPLPGLGLFVAAGAASYALGPGRGNRAGKVLVAVDLVLAATILLRRRRHVEAASPPLSRARSGGDAASTGRILALCYVSLVAAVFLDSAIRTPMGEDFWAGSSLQARMAASPPDNAIPYKTAAYLTLPRHTAALSERFFWKGWSARSRGPLMPLAILGAFGLAPPAVQAGGDASQGPWPAAIDSFYLARFLGILTNACVLLAAAELLTALGAEPAASRYALVWLTLAPVTWINVAFVWPKLLAAYFLLLAAASAARRERGWVAGAWLAASYFAHPLGALFALPLLLWAANRGGIRSAAAAAAAAALPVIPWLWLKHHSHQDDPFLRYALGDGRAVLPAASFATWLGARARNLWYTLAPGAWFFSAAARVWRHGALSPLLAWSVQYSKSLPAELGYSCAWIPLLAARRLRAAPFVRWFLLPGFLLALIYWGYSADGLGRNCLEPLTVGLIVCAGAVWPLSRRASRVLFLLLWLETLVLVAAGMAGRAGFTWAGVPALDYGLFAALALIFAVPLAAI